MPFRIILIVTVNMTMATCAPLNEKKIIMKRLGHIFRHFFLCARRSAWSFQAFPILCVPNVIKSCRLGAKRYQRRKKWELRQMKRRKRKIRKEKKEDGGWTGVEIILWDMTRVRLWVYSCMGYGVVCICRTSIVSSSLICSVRVVWSIFVGV